MEAIRDFFEDVYDWLVDHSTGVVGVVCAVLLGFAGFSVYGMFAAKDASAIEQADNDAKISELQDQVKKLESNAQDADADVSTKQHFATESGQLVAEAQTKLISSDATSTQRRCGLVLCPRRQICTRGHSQQRTVLPKVRKMCCGCVT